VDKCGHRVLVVMVEMRGAGVVSCGDGKYQVESGSAQKSSASAGENQRARLEREHRNVNDAASFLVELGRLATVDDWEQGRIVEIRAEGEQRRREHRQAGAAALSRMQTRGETLTAIAELAGVKVSDVRAMLKSAGAQRVAVRIFRVRIRATVSGAVSCESWWPAANSVAIAGAAARRRWSSRRVQSRPAPLRCRRDC
jgi:hypothetical protein